jgi:hypothetical protein
MWLPIIFCLNFQIESADQCISIWLKGFGEKREMLVVGIDVVICSTWKTRNLACFEKKLA